MICAHRGDTSLGAIENSISAIDTALATGAEMIEIDVQMTLDGVLICHHDLILEGDSLPIWQRTYSDLVSRSNSNALPKFEEILRHTAGKAYLNIEMKDYSGFHPSRYVHPLVALVKQYGMHEYSLYSSFRSDYISALPWDSLSVMIRPTGDVIEYFNKYAISPVIFPKPVEAMMPSEVMKFSKATSYACMLTEIDENAYRDMVTHHIFLSVYTLQTEAEFHQALKVGARAIVTDHPHLFTEYRNSLSQSVS